MESIRTWHLLTLAVVALLGVGRGDGRFGVDVAFGYRRRFRGGMRGSNKLSSRGWRIVAFALASRFKVEWFTTSVRESRHSLLRFAFTPAAWGMIVATLLCLLVLTPFGTTVNGASRWIRFGRSRFNLQNSQSGR